MSNWFWVFKSMGWQPEKWQQDYWSTTSVRNIYYPLAVFVHCSQWKCVRGFAAVWIHSGSSVRAAAAAAVIAFPETPWTQPSSCDCSHWVCLSFLRNPEHHPVPDHGCPWAPPSWKCHFSFATLIKIRSILLPSVGPFRISLKVGLSHVSVIMSPLLRRQSWSVISCSAINSLFKDIGEKYLNYVPFISH